ncbi:hypothetical protein F5B18DRAFT_640659 [Nemania serpens]|nr:hypothetical protein F5B18DRAFT_640659 [Nemania serpens]
MGWCWAGCDLACWFLGHAVICDQGNFRACQGETKPHELKVCGKKQEQVTVLCPDKDGERDKSCKLDAVDQVRLNEPISTCGVARS